MASRTLRSAGAVGAVVVCFSVVLHSAPAFAVAPVTTPTITTPVDSDVVGGIVNVSATSTAETVQFSVDGSLLGAPVAVVTGSATTSWDTWGLDTGVSHVITAADCNVDGCGPSSAAVTVTLDNSAPVLTAPTSGQNVGVNAILSATAGGGSVAFIIDDVQVGVDTSSPFTWSATGLAQGAHTASVQSCDVAGSACDGPTATPVAFTVIALHPSIGSVSPSPFSPNGDGRRDSTTATFTLDIRSTVTWLVTSVATGLPVAGPHGLGMMAPGRHTRTWSGKNNSGLPVPDGVYTFAIATARTIDGSVISGIARRNVQVDRTAPRLSGETGIGATFYPYPDGYSDTFKPNVHVNTGATLRLSIKDGSGHIVRAIAAQHAAAGTFTIAWNGRSSSGAFVRPGRYTFAFTAEDVAGNRRTTDWHSVHVSGAKLVNKVATITHNGDTAYDILTSDSSCTAASYSLSSFAHGVWLGNVCDPNIDGFQAVFADYSFSVPSATRYNNVRVESYGNSIETPERIAALIYNSSKHQWQAVGAASLTHYGKNEWANFGAVSAAGRVAGHVVRVSIAVPDVDTPEDYDIGSVKIIVSYSVLQ